MKDNLGKVRENTQMIENIERKSELMMQESNNFRSMATAFK